MIEGHHEWDIEEAFYTNKRGFDPEKARILAICDGCITVTSGR